MTKKHIFVFILVFLSFFQALPVFAQGLQCDNCGTSITYSNFGSKTKTGYLCKSCYRQQQEHPQQQKQTQQNVQQTQQQKQAQQQQQTQQQSQGMQCDNCGISIKHNELGATLIYENHLGVKTKTAYLCKDCYRQRQEQKQQEQKKEQKQTQQKQQIQHQSQGMHCDNCDISITSYSLLGTKTNTGYLCKNCYRNKQKEQQHRAESKNQWLQKKQQQQQQQQSKEQQKHQQESKEQQKHSICTLCNNPLKAGKKYYLIHDKPFCLNCYDTFKENCNTCGYKIPPNEVVRNGSWVVCTSCSKDIATTNSQLKECYAEACAFMKSYFGLNVPVSVENVCFSDISEIKRMTTRDYATDPCGLFVDGNKILVQKGMSKFATIKTLVHESGHACMYQFGYQKESSYKSNYRYEEGFAEWCEYKYVMSVGKPWSGTEDIVYAEGLKKMLELEKKMTEDGLLEYVKKHSDFPEE